MKNRFYCSYIVLRWRIGRITHTSSTKEVARKQGGERERKEGRKLANSLEFGDLSLLFSHRVPLVDKLSSRQSRISFVKNLVFGIKLTLSEFVNKWNRQECGEGIYYFGLFVVRKFRLIGGMQNSIGERILSYLQKHNFPGYVISVTSYQLDWVLNYLKQWVQEKL